MYKHPRSVVDKVFDVWRSPGRFTKNPDMVRLPSGRLLLVYSDNDAHWSQETQVLTILASDDDGRTWSKLAEVDSADLPKGDERLVTPRLSLLRDGRLVVVIDHDDHSHFHVNQAPGNWAYWSADGGKTWSEHQDTGIIGFEPDRMMELPDGRLAVASHVMMPEDQEFADVLSCSDDGGQTWYTASTIAYDGYHRFCEGAIVILDGGELACVMRENHSRGIPSFVAFSEDAGRTWTRPQRLPFAIHRPYAKQLSDGRVLVTGRHVNGPIGAYAWAGDLKAEAGTYQVGGPRTEYRAELTAEALVIHNTSDLGCRYTLLPPESSLSEVLMEAVVKVEGQPGTPVAFMAISYLGVVLSIAPGGIGTRFGVDFQRPVDMTTYRRLTLHHKGGLLRVLVDGETVISQCIFREDVPAGGMYGQGALHSMTQFGELGDHGSSSWCSLTYEVRNRTIEDWQWEWRAGDGAWPDQYQRDRMIQIHANELTEDHRPDHGYSSWLVLPDGRIIFVDYTNLGDPMGKSHLVGVYLEPDDIA
jgi:hypothetical protein